MNTQLQQPSTINDIIAAFRKKSAAIVEVWQPEPGDQLIGEIVGSQKAVGAYGENYQMLIRDEAGNVTATWITAWLKENLRAQGAGHGDIICLTFIGKKKSPSGRNYNAYSLIVDKLAPVPMNTETICQSEINNELKKQRDNNYGI